MDAIQLKNGIILAITKNDILKIKVNDNKYEISKLSKFPSKNGVKLSIYKLPKKNILISSILIKQRLFNCGHQFLFNFEYNNIEIIFNLEKRKIIKTLENYGSVKN